MRRHLLPLLGALSCALLAPPREAAAMGALGSGEQFLVEQRIALSRAPGGVALWSQLRLDGDAGAVGVVLPVGPGGAAAWSSRAFFEALEVATAPRVIGPDGASSTCPGGDADDPAVHVTEDLVGSVPLEAVELAMLGSRSEVATWASQRGLTLDAGLSAALDASGATAFVVARFDKPEGPHLTPTLRVVTPGAAPVLPIVLTRAGQQAVAVTAWTLGPGRSVLEGDPVVLDTSDLVLDVAEESSSYATVVAQALASPGAVLVEASSHEALRDNLTAGPSGPTIESVARAYFERAATYGETTEDLAGCIAQAAVVLGQSATVGTVCPRATIGVAPGGPTCTQDVVGVGEVDPELLRCGPLADDLAVVVSDLEPDDAWVTRSVLRIPAQSFGADLDVSFAVGPRLDPVVKAEGVDYSGCGGAGGAGGASSSGSGSGSGSGPGPGSGSGSGGPYEVPVYQYDGCACNGTWVVVDYVEESESDGPDAYYVSDDEGCDSDTTDTYSDSSLSASSDDCAGDTTGSDGDSFTDEGCSCDGVESGDSVAADDCGGDSSADACSGDSSADACSGDSAADSCGGGEDCAVRGERARRPTRRLNGLVYALLVVLVPLRRLTRRKRRR